MCVSRGRLNTNTTVYMNSHSELKRGGYFLRASKKAGGKGGKGDGEEDRARVEDEGAPVPVDDAGVVRELVV